MTDSVLITRCGRDGSPITLKSVKEVVLKFHSDYMVMGAGFDLKYSAASTANGKTKPSDFYMH